MTERDGDSDIVTAVAYAGFARVTDHEFAYAWIIGAVVVIIAVGVLA